MCVCVHARTFKCGRSNGIQNNTDETGLSAELTRFSLNTFMRRYCVRCCEDTLTHSYQYWLGSMKLNFLGCQLRFGIMNHVNVRRERARVCAVCTWTRHFFHAKYHHFRWYMCRLVQVSVRVRVHCALCLWHRNSGLLYSPFRDSKNWLIHRSRKCIKINR